jgi:hypothetical protein
MTRTLKFLGLALIAMSAVGVSMAWADPEFHSEKEKTTWTGKQDGEDIFTTDAGTVECFLSKYHGTQPKSTTKTMTVMAEYACLDSIIHMNGCEYRFHVEKVEEGKYEGSYDISCTGSNEITITMEKLSTVKCTIHIPPQSGLKTVTFTNAGGGGPTQEITTEINTTSITYSQTEGTGLGRCPNGEDTNNGKYSGKAIFTGEEDVAEEPKHVGIWVK